MKLTIQNAHTIEIEQVLNDFETSLDDGLSQTEVDSRLNQYGKNALDAEEKVSALKILLHNVNNLIVYLLMIAAVVSFIMGETVEGFAIIVAILIAVLSGFITEFNAQKSIESLQQLAKNKAKVRRDSSITEIDSENLVVGDILFIEEGDLITADARIVRGTNFATIESALTGESEAVDKDHEYLGEEDTPLGDRKNMVYTGTAATRGNAYAVVTGTGMNTEIGKIRELISSEDSSKSPLETQLNRLGKLLVLFAAAVSALIVVLGVLNGQEPYTIIKIGIILAISSIPEALPAVSTITLAIGMGTMAKHNALVKSLPAVETLGSTTVICTDKTGTLTENQMTVHSIYLAESEEYFEVEGEGYNPSGKIRRDGEELTELHEELKDFVVSGILNSNASLIEDENQFRVVGDPTEGGIVVLGEKVSLRRKDLEESDFERIGEIPFDSTAKYMVTAYEHQDGGKVLYIKGAPDALMDMAIDNENKMDEWDTVNERLAGEGMRVLGIGRVRDYSGDGSAEAMQQAVEQGIELQGFIGIIDPPRADVKQAIAEAQQAGIRVIMITGDHPTTAKIIADRIGMEHTDEVITGREMDQMSDEELAEKILTVSVFARVSPENKLQIVRALNIDNEVTAMTGDGVNDAPALNAADIGIAMGIRGTEVAKDASDMILTDDRFSTIVDAVREGRIIFDNIQKFVYFLFSCNVVEILAILIATVARLPMPVIALQILWLNLVVDVFPAMSLAWEKGEGDVMARKPRDPMQAIVNRPFLIRILGNGSLISLGAMAIFLFAINQGFPEETSRTMAFATMAFGQLFHIFNVRSKEPIWCMKTTFHNPYLLGGLVTSAILMILVVYVPFFHSVMGTVALDTYKWGYVALGSVLPTMIIQISRRCRFTND